MSMASSSLSQESLDIDDYDIARRCRQRHLRSRVVVHKNESLETTDDPRDVEEGLMEDRRDEDASWAATGQSWPDEALWGGEHESPTRTGTSSRQKDKRGRLNHLHKGKTVKDKRKLREKRRSTGVVHLASTESTGDSLDEGDGKDPETAQTRRNTSYNEVIDADNPQTPEEERKSFSSRNVRNKSPSDLDADLEDNQDYDSTVSQSETNLTMIGRCAASGATGASGNYSMEASPQTVHTVATNRAVIHPAPRPLSYPTSRHHDNQGRGNDDTGPKRPVARLEGRPLGVHFSEDLSNGSGGSIKRSCTSQDGMEARLLAKTVQLEKQLEKEREEKRHLQELLDERDNKITQLQRQLALLNKDLMDADEDNDRLQEENDTLLRAISAMSVQ